ncbi:MAG: hypothetical protein ABIV63_11635, partial [Caldimonas sp.]
AQPVTTAELDHLDMLLVEADYEAVTLFRELAPSLRSQFGAAATDVEMQVRNFEYERALMSLRAMRSLRQ